MCFMCFWITSAGVRRLLEEDLELDKYTLDSFKKFISGELDKVLTSPKAPESAPVVQKKSSKKNSHKRIPEKISTAGSSDSLDSESEEVEDKVKSKKKVTLKGKVHKSEELKNRKRPAMEGKISCKKRNKVAETSRENSDVEGGDKSEDDQSQYFAENPVKKKEVSAPAYGKQVENLKSTIKSCGMRFPFFDSRFLDDTLQKSFDEVFVHRKVVFGYFWSNTWSGSLYECRPRFLFVLKACIP